MRRLVVVGDVHGDRLGLQATLVDAAVCDLFGHWTGGSTCVLQLGDCIDRGADGSGALQFLKKLQEDAEDDGGSVVRLVGNHELDLVALVAGHVRARGGLPDPEGLAEWLRTEMESGQMVAAVAIEGLLFVHGGFTAQSLAEAERHLGPLRSAAEAAAKLNRVLEVAARTRRFTNMVFGHNGPFWNYAPKHPQDRRRPLGFTQVVGHSLSDTPFGRLPEFLTLDQGLSAAMLGHRSYLVIETAARGAGRATPPTLHLAWHHQSYDHVWHEERRILRLPRTKRCD